ncbi:MAG: PGN_0703 family putative restriction endonuclease [Flavobacteriales bacterium]
MDTTPIEAQVYQSGNSWQKNRFAHMASINDAGAITRFGHSDRGNSFKHLLQEADALHNFLGDEKTLNVVHQRFAAHKAGDRVRALTNMVASQPCCFNLFAPLWRNRAMADALFSHLLGSALHVEHLEIEFTPNKWDDMRLPDFKRLSDESIGDQSAVVGTDADVAVFYKKESGVRGVVLLEFKYIEAEFSTCGSYHNKIKGPRIRTGCDAEDWYAQRIAPHKAQQTAKPDCGYLKYDNWSLLESSAVLDADAVRALPSCPFKGSQNQLWRNMLLAERVAAARNLEEFHFWVLAPVQNTYLWQEHGGHVAERFRDILTADGKAAFRQLELDTDVMQFLEGVAEEDQKEWLSRFRARYLV